METVSSDLPSDLPTEADIEDDNIMVYSTNICTITIIFLIYEKLLLF
jgi:hypothetical protein